MACNEDQIVDAFIENDMYWNNRLNDLRNNDDDDDRMSLCSEEPLEATEDEDEAIHEDEVVHEDRFAYDEENINLLQKEVEINATEPKNFNGLFF